MARENVGAKENLGQNSNSFCFQSAQGWVYYESKTSPILASYTAGDVVGCSLVRTTNTAFTKNGQKVGEVSLQKFSNVLYPAVTLFARTQHTGVAVIVNFGQRPFEFDVRGYAQVKDQ
jgi:SPRY domain